jgi:tetratricopeptide (TPR) repeat protein
VAKNPKSLLFAYLADSLRESSLGIGEKLDEALKVANKGLDANPDFLQGLLVRGRILFEKGDLSGAKIDFETVAMRDQFCLSAQKFLLEISEKLKEPLNTEVYAKILNTFETEHSSSAVAEPDLVPFERATKKTEAVASLLSAALDDVLTEEDDDEIKLLAMISQTIDKVILKNVANAAKTPPASPAKPESKSAPKPEPKSAPKSEPKPLPSLSLPEASSSSIFEKPAPKPAPSPKQASQSPPNLDDLVKEQLASKVEGIPDLTKDMDSLLANAVAVEPKPEPAPALTSHIPAAPPNLDDLVKEQLASKVEDIPDLTKDMASLLADATAVKPEPEPALTSHISAAPPNLDDLVKEQLASKVEDIPDLTKDMASLLADANSESEEPDIVPYVPAASATAATPAAVPNIDDLVNEQLASKVEDIPDLTKDMASLLSNAISESEEPDIVPYTPAASATAPAAAPNIDDLVNEQLASKVEDIPDLTKDMASLLASAADESPTAENEPELRPYVPPSKRNTSATPVAAAPDENTDAKPKHPTLTLAELYMDQGLPKKAIEVYKELLLLEPNNEDLKTKLALAEIQAQT